MKVLPFKVVILQRCQHKGTKSVTYHFINKVATILIFLLLSAMQMVAAPTNFFVDPVNGSDFNSGTSLAEALKTIEKAREVVQTINKSMKGNITVNLRGGNYLLPNTLLLDQNDGGFNGFNVIYKNYKDEYPVISGGQQIVDWKLFDKTNNIYRAFAGNTSFRQLYINGKWGVRARTPNNNVLKIVEWDCKNKEIKFQASEIERWKNLQKVEIVTYNAWTTNHLRIKDFKKDATFAYISIRPQEELIFNVMEPFFHGKEYFLENAYEFLDDPGEWYYNPTDSFVYYKPRENENIMLAEVIAPKLENIFRIEGASLNTMAANIQFQGVAFMHSAWYRPDNYGNVEMQATQYFAPNSGKGDYEFTGRPASGVLVKNAHHIVFEHCLFANMGATALDFISGTNHDQITANVFRDIAGNGVSFGLTPPEDISNMTLLNPAHKKETCSDELVKNNYFTRIGKYYEGGVAVFYTYPQNMTIEHNEIEDIPFTGIHAGWGWKSGVNAMQNNIIRYNHVHNYMTKLYDGGGIYTLSSQSNSVCSENYIENRTAQARGYGWCGIYFDEGSRYFDVEKNVVEVPQDDEIYWLSMQQVGEGASECYINNNYTTSTTFHDNKKPVLNTVYCPNAQWPNEALDIIKRAGIEPEFQGIKNSIYSK